MPRIAEFEAKPRDFRMERHVLGSGRSVSGRRRVTPRRLRNVVLADGNRPTSDGKRLLRTATARSAAVLTARKAALFACETMKNILREFQIEIPLKIFRNKDFSCATKRLPGARNRFKFLGKVGVQGAENLSLSKEGFPPPAKHYFTISSGWTWEAKAMPPARLWQSKPYAESMRQAI